MEEKLQRQIDELKQEVERLKQRRVYQSDLAPTVVKSRHFGEGNPYFYAGLEANLPPGNVVTSSVTCYFATDTDDLWIWNGTAWVSVTLS